MCLCFTDVMAFLPALPFLAASLVREENKSGGKRLTHNWLLFPHRVDGLVGSMYNEEDKVPVAKEVFYSSSTAGYVARIRCCEIIRRFINAFRGDSRNTDVLKWFTTIIGTSVGETDPLRPWLRAIHTILYLIHLNLACLACQVPCDVIIAYAVEATLPLYGLHMSNDPLHRNDIHPSNRGILNPKDVQIAAAPVTC